MKMDFNTGGTWGCIGQWTLMTKTYDLFYLAKTFSSLIKIMRRWKISYILSFYKATKRLSRIKNNKFSSLVFNAQSDAKCLQW